MRRRTTLVLGVAALAAAALGVALRRKMTAPLSTAEAALWSARFERPDGRTLEMSALFGQPLLLNFWATWCPPCVEEMPEIDRFARAHPGVRVVGLAIDSPTPVRQFLQKTPVSYAIALAAFEGTELSRTLGNERGALPFTVLFNNHGTLVQRKLGATSYDELVRWAAAL